MVIIRKSILLIVTFTGYIYIGYYLDRQEFMNLCFSMLSLFLATFFLLKEKAIPYKYYWYLALAVRILLFFSMPTLSDDYYRFIWDGRLSIAGISPFEALPSFYVSDSINVVHGLTKELYLGLNSPNYFTIYPPICQGIFWISAKLMSPHLLGQVVIMRFFILLAEVITFLGLKRILSYLDINQNNLWLYALNPLVILELVGNLHFEALMIAGIVWALYFILQGKWWQSALCLLLAINTKLLPLILLPSLLPLLGLRRAAYYYIIIGFGTFIAFSPFISSDMLIHISESINLYFQSFEFNAGVYYILRWAGYEITGYNMIKYLGPVLSILILIIILSISWKKNTSRDKYMLPESWLWVFLIYLLGATVIHPWYILILLALGVLTKYRFAIVWSISVLLSYSAYQSESYQENLVLIGIEYSLFLLYLFWEVRKKTSKKI